MHETVLPNGLRIAEINSYETQFLYDEIFVQNTYASYGVHVAPGDVVFDVGANIGLFALYMAERFNPGRIVCFEPAPHCREAATRNLAPLGDRVVLSPMALGDAVGKAAFTYYPKYTLMSSMLADAQRDTDALLSGARTGFERQHGAAPKGRVAELLEMNVRAKLEDAQSFRCPLTTFSQAIRDYGVGRVALAKIDVECAENLVLAGIAEPDWARVDQLIVEVHDQGAREHEAMREMLRGRGYEVSLFAEPGLQNAGIYVVVARRP